jgi:hypothetical protein
MDIEDAIGEGSDEIRRQQAHVAGEADQIDFVLVENGDHLAVEGFALKSFGWNDAGGEAALPGAIDPRGAVAIAEDNRDFGVGDAACGDAFGESLEVGTAATQQHGNSLGHKLGTVPQLGMGLGGVHPLPRFPRSVDSKGVTNRFCGSSDSNKVKGLCFVSEGRSFVSVDSRQLKVFCFDTDLEIRGSADSKGVTGRAACRERGNTKKDSTGLTISQHNP